MHDLALNNIDKVHNHRLGKTIIATCSDDFILRLIV